MKELLPRERFIRALRHEPTDRVPLLYRMKHEAKEKLARIYGIEDAATGRKHNPALELRLGNDAIIYQIGINADFRPARKDTCGADSPSGSEGRAAFAAASGRPCRLGANRGQRGAGISTAFVVPVTICQMQDRRVS